MSQPPWAEGGPAGVALAKFLVHLADSKFFLGRRVADWSVGAPELESAVACAAVAQEELGHARVLYPLVAELSHDPELAPLEREGDRPVVFCPECLTRPWDSWPELVVNLALVDTALTVALEALVPSAHEELARRAARMVEEERFHGVFAWGRVRALLRGSSGGQVRGLLSARWEEVAGWLSAAAEEGEVLQAAGLVHARAAELVDGYLRRVQEELEPANVRLPEAARRSGGPARRA